MELLSLFITSVIPVIKVLLVIAVGLLLVTESVDLLEPSAKHHLNNLVFYVFFPALIGCSLVDTITVESLSTLWFMPLNIFISCIIGSTLGWVLVTVTRTPRHLHGLVIACSSAANMGNMLLIILPALCEETNSLFGDSSLLCIWRGLCFTFSSGSSEENIYQVALPQSRDEANQKISTFGKIKQCFMIVIRNKSDDFCTIYNCSRCIERKKHHSVLEIALAILAGWSKVLSGYGIRVSIVGFIVGIVSPFRKALVSSSSPLRVIFSSIDMIGEAGIPSITLIVGANLLKGLKGSGVKTSLIVGILVIRNILLPASGIGVVKTAKSLGMVESDSMYEFTLLLQYAIPPAMKIGTISQMLGTGESEFSVLMLWTYVGAAFSLTLWTTFYMWLVT